METQYTLEVLFEGESLRMVFTTYSLGGAGGCKYCCFNDPETELCKKTNKAEFRWECRTFKNTIIDGYCNSESVLFHFERLDHEITQEECDYNIEKLQIQFKLEQL